MANYCMIGGYLTRVPELQENQNGTPMCFFTLKVKKDSQFASNRRGMWNSYFIPCKAYGAIATSFQNACTEGCFVLIKDGYIDIWEKEILDPDTLKKVRKVDFAVVVKLFDIPIGKYDPKIGGGLISGEDISSDDYLTGADREPLPFDL